MDVQTKELIVAIGASTTANSAACLRFHLDMARKAGVEEAEIRETVRVGRRVRKEAASMWDTEATALLGMESAANSGEGKVLTRTQ